MKLSSCTACGYHALMSCMGSSSSSSVAKAGIGTEEAASSALMACMYRKCMHGRVEGECTLSMALMLGPGAMPMPDITLSIGITLPVGAIMLLVIKHL